MTFAEELTLLLLSEESGHFAPIPEWRIQCVMAGAVLMDLALANRIDTDETKLVVVDPTPTDDTLLDTPLGELVATHEPQTTQFWIERIALKAHDIFLDALERLTESGVLLYDEGGFWSLSDRTKTASRILAMRGKVSETGDDVKLRILNVIYTDDIPDPRDIAIVSLVEACEVFTLMLGVDEYEQVKERIDLLCRMDLIGRSVAEAVNASFKAPRSASVLPTKQIPEFRLKDALFSKSFWSGNLPKFVADQIERFGPVFRIGALNKNIYVIGGADLNRWVNRRGRFYLRSKEYLEEFQKEWGVARTVASMDGADHYRLRKAMRDGNARTVLENRLGEMYALIRDYLSRLNHSEIHGGEYVCQRMISEQISRFSVSIDMEDYYDDIYDYEARALMTHAYGVLPKFAMKTPKMKRQRNRINELYAKIHGSHSPAQRAGKHRDLVDDMLALHSADPQFLPETDIGFACVAPLIAGHYSGSQLSFALYSFLTQPEIREQIIQEADVIFENGDPTHESLRSANFDVTRRFVMEVFRLYCVIPHHMRHSMNTIQINGMEIPPDQDVIVSHTSAHYLEENFQDPTKFDINRYLPPRDEHKKPGAYQPFGVGTHTCLGQRWAEFQLIVNILLIAYHLDVEMVPKNYKLKINPFPKLKPNKKFKFKINGFRHSLEARTAHAKEQALAEV